MKGYIGFFSSGRDAVPELERENDLEFLEMIEDYNEEDDGIDDLVNQINILAMDRDKAVNPQRPVPTQVDWLDEMMWNTDWYQQYFDIHGNSLGIAMTEKAMKEVVDYMESVPVREKS